MKNRYVGSAFVWLAAGLFILIQPARANQVVHLPTDEVVKQKMGGGGDDALPSGSGVEPRSPGMSLPADENKLANPFAPVKKERPKTPEEVESQIRNQAFAAALTGLLPLKPNEIRKLLETFDQTRQAVETPVFPDPTPEVLAQTASIDPGSPPMEIKLATGRVTTVTFVDVTGEPWPIGDITWAGNFEVAKPEPGGYIIRITPQSEFAIGNMSVAMAGNLKTPLVFALKTHRDKVYYRLDVRIPDYGPFAKQPLTEDGGPELTAGDSAQNQILDGIEPSGAVKLSVSGVDHRTSAYKMGDVTYVRTPLTMLSPGWSNSVSSADGTSVYTIQSAPVVLLSDKGKVMQAYLSDRDLPKESSAVATIPVAANSQTAASNPTSPANAGGNP
jgi:intracellular multiplication protein IcmK